MAAPPGRHREGLRSRLGAHRNRRAPAGVAYWGGGSPIETIRFAGASRLLVEFGYHGRVRLVEPYSLRRAQTGSLLLYAWEHGATHIKAFSVAEIRSVRVTDTPFTPRYRVELTAAGSLSAPPGEGPAGAIAGRWRARAW